MRDQVFISYSHEDAKYMKELLKHLKPFSRSGAVTAWSDEQIAKGSQWFEEIQTALEKTSVAVLLVSPDFFASDFIHEHELGLLLKEAEAGGVRILWVPLRPSAFEETPLAKYQAVSPPNRPLSQMNKADRDEAWVRICKEIKKASAAPAGTAGSSPKPPSGAASSSAPSAVGGPALKVWQEKLDYLLEQEAVVSDPNQRFQLRKNIEEARQKIRELGGQA